MQHFSTRKVSLNRLNSLTYVSVCVYVYLCMSVSVCACMYVYECVSYASESEGKRTHRQRTETTSIICLHQDRAFP